MDYNSEQEDSPRKIMDWKLWGSAELAARARQIMGGGDDGLWMATTFKPPLDSTNAELPPDEVFPLRKTTTSTGDVERFCIRRRFVPSFSGLKTMCIYIGGTCLDNSSSVDQQPSAGASFVFRSPNGTISLALENNGVDGEAYAHTNDRAELRAVIAALRFRFWWGEGWQRMVFVTNAEYVANHATASLRDWASRDWCDASGQPIANKDLWKELSAAMGEYAQGGCEVSFWPVPSRLNCMADRAAKAAAKEGGGSNQFSNPIGVLC